MKYLLLGLASFLFLVNNALAFNPVISEVEVPYEIISVENYETPQLYLGELLDYPIMYEMTSETGFPFSVKVMQEFENNSEPIPFSLIVVRKNNRGGGVKEVLRHNFKTEDWQSYQSRKIGMTFWQSLALEEDLQPGTYRIEISTPKNEGRYLLSFGVGEDYDGYFTDLAGIRRTQKFFGHSIFKMLTSSHVYYALGFIIVMMFVFKKLFYRKLFSHAD